MRNKENKKEEELKLQYDLIKPLLKERYKEEDKSNVYIALLFSICVGFIMFGGIFRNWHLIISGTILLIFFAWGSSQ